MPGAMTQVKFTIESDIVSTFKARCADEGVSMTSMIRRWMKTRNPAREAKASATSELTRPRRRKAVLEAISLLTIVMAAEAEYRDRVPEQFAQRYEAADHACELLADAISCLEEAF